MKNTAVAACFVLAAFVAVPEVFAENVLVSTPSSALLLDARKGEKLRHIYYGGPLADADVKSLRSAHGKGLVAYPDYGLITVTETALAARHADGDMTLDLRVDTLFRSDNNGASMTTIRLRDSKYPFVVDVNYQTYPGEDIIEAWTVISHEEPAPVTLTRFASTYLPMRASNAWMMSLYGNHNNECRLESRPIPRGMTVVKNRDGVRNAHFSHPEVLFSLDGEPDENHGRVIGAALCYSGNYKLRLDYDNDNVYHFFAGINEEDSPYTIAAGETFTTPTVALTYSAEGLGGVSRAFHKWGRKHRLANPGRERKVLLNSWEGVYFDINEPGMEAMMKDIADMGGELFVMDDGWFGIKYPRDSDKQGLGDWVVNPRKLPHGIKGLLKAAEKNGIRFGIWIEPEMVNARSELVERHPDWVLKPAGRAPVYGRGGGQLVLDLANPAVQEHVFTIVDTLMTNYPEIDYIKWDANMSILNHGSQYLPAAQQSHLFIDYHKGLEKTLQRIRAKYPDLTIQACAGGGGRVNYGLLPYFDEVWVSDNTDPLQRIFIQWGYSYFYPAIAMGSHISASPNHHTHRIIPIKFRCDVAMSGRLGMEIQPKDMTEREKDICRQAIADYKSVRPVVQFGDLYRLVSPESNQGVASLMYVGPDKKRAVFYWYKMREFAHDNLPRVAMAGLDAGRLYKVTELNRVDTKPLAYEGKVFSGRFLMENGLEMPVKNRVDGERLTDFASRILLLEAVE